MVIKTDNFRGDLSDISAKTATLYGTPPNFYSLRIGVRLQLDQAEVEDITAAQDVVGGLWGGGVEVIQSERVPKSRFYSLLETENQDVDDSDMDEEEPREEVCFFSRIDKILLELWPVKFSQI